MRVFLWFSFSVLALLISQPARASDAIVSEGVIDAPVSAVWMAWTTSDGLRAWLAPHAEIDLRIDGVMRSNYDPNGSLGGSGTIENRILAYEPQRMLSIKVTKAPERFPFKSTVQEMWTVLYFQSTLDGKTLLRIVGMGFGTDEASQKMKDYFKRGNAYTLSQIQTYFQR